MAKIGAEIGVTATDSLRKQFHCGNNVQLLILLQPKAFTICYDHVRGSLLPKLVPLWKLKNDIFCVGQLEIRNTFGTLVDKYNELIWLLHVAQHRFPTLVLEHSLSYTFLCLPSSITPTSTQKGLLMSWLVKSDVSEQGKHSNVQDREYSRGDVEIFCSTTIPFQSGEPEMD